MYKVPILFLVFNRPDTTKIVFEAIRKVKPKRLFIAADGPRKHKNEEQKCVQAREIALNIDWPCEVNTLFRNENLGCGLAVSQAISWFFSKVEEGIILEDDCLPSTSFFCFCEQLLIKYKYNERIFHISGNNFQNGFWRGSGDYYFSKFSHSWGWATWRRAWLLYNYNIYIDKVVLERNFPGKRFRRLKHNWYSNFDDLQKKHINTWDYQWHYTCWVNDALSIIPNKNLVLNIGFGIDSTHTSKVPVFYNKAILENITCNLIHPSVIAVDLDADYYDENIRSSRSNTIQWLINLMWKKIFF